MRRNYELAFRMSQKRWIYVPTDACRNVGAKIIRLISEKWSPPDIYYHFKKGGHVAAIEAHQDNAYFAKIDIKNFFPSISRNRVLNSLKKIGFSYKQADEITDWSCVVSKDNKSSRILPYGFVQSQIISALCLDKSAVGKYLREINFEDITVSVYVDDIVLSSNDSQFLAQVYAGLLEAVNCSGFEINEGKSHSVQKNLVSFNIILQSNELQITDDRYKEFLEKLSASVPQRSEAIISYVSRICQKQGAQITQRYEELMVSNSGE